MSLLKTLLNQASIRCSRLLASRSTVFLWERKCHGPTGEMRNTDQHKTTQHDDKDLKKDSETQSTFSNLRPGNGYIPTADVYEETINGLKFEELPTLHINCTKNNTKAWFSQENEDGKIIITQNTAGMCGYRNKKKSTSAAAQTVGYQLGKVMTKRGMSHIRVELKGPGQRFSVLNGLVIGGATIVSISDKTYPTFNLRPISKRRI